MPALWELSDLPITLVAIVGLVALLTLLRVGNVVRYIPNDQVGIVEKMWSLRGSIKGGFIPLTGQAGFQPEILRGGIHVFFPFAYRVHRKPLVTIAQGRLGYVFARDCAPLRTGQAHGANGP